MLFKSVPGKVTPTLAQAEVAAFCGRLIAPVGGDAALAVDHDGGTPAIATTTVVGRYPRACTVAGRIAFLSFRKKSNELRDIEYKYKGNFE